MPINGETTRFRLIAVVGHRLSRVQFFRVSRLPTYETRATFNMRPNSNFFHHVSMV
jgi:hypothetical protein